MEVKKWRKKGVKAQWHSAELTFWFDLLEQDYTRSHPLY
jgi:hypothetical protein